MTFLYVLLGFGAIVLFHELGHFVAARLAGLEVERFSIGFPPHILKIRTRRTEFCIGAIPLGGYVKVDLGTSGEEKVPDRPWHARLLTALAGPVFNFVLAVILFFLVLGVTGQEEAVFLNVIGPGGNSLGLAEGDTVLAVNGIDTPDYGSAALEMARHPSGTLLAGTAEGRREYAYTLDGPGEAPGFQPLIPPVLGESIIGLPAYEAGLRAGDSLISVDGSPVHSWADLLEAVEGASGSGLVIEYAREGSVFTAVMEPLVLEGSPRIGVVARTSLVNVRYPLGEAFLYSVGAAAGGTVFVYRTLASVFTRPVELVQMSGGPIYVAETLGQEAGRGIPRLLEAVAGISIAVMCFNLLPIPLLDGGQMLLLLYEGVFRRRPSARAVQAAQRIGLLVILVLFVLIMWRDLSRIFLRVTR